MPPYGVRRMTQPPVKHGDAENRPLSARGTPDAKSHATCFGLKDAGSVRYGSPRRRDITRFRIHSSDACAAPAMSAPNTSLLTLIKGGPPTSFGNSSTVAL